MHQVLFFGQYPFWKSLVYASRVVLCFIKLRAVVLYSAISSSYIRAYRWLSSVASTSEAASYGLLPPYHHHQTHAVQRKGKDAQPARARISASAPDVQYSTLPRCTSAGLGLRPLARILCDRVHSGTVCTLWPCGVSPVLCVTAAAAERSPTPPPRAPAPCGWQTSAPAQPRAAAPSPPPAPAPQSP